VCHNVSLTKKLSDFVDLDLGEFLTVAIALLETLATDLLEYKHLVSAALVVEHGSPDHGAVNIRSTDLHGRIICGDEEDLVKLHGITLGSREAVDKDFVASFHLELLACNVYDCVHKNKLVKSFGRKRLQLSSSFSMA
jgi:hypothetical protein